ncbi:MAG: amidase family protein, partial [Hyphomicrobiales bacterium]
MTEPAFQPLSALARKIADRELSSAELLDHYIARIERHNPSLNAIVAMDLDRARDEAARADEALAGGGAARPLHGVPVTIKDAYEVAGLVSTGGVPGLRDHVPAEDAVAVARLRRAGAIIVGKTNVPAYS